MVNGTMTKQSTVVPPRTRTAGILLHPTSRPGPYGIGDLGPAARAWVDLLARAGQTWWQLLPLTPPGEGDSPYQAFSAFAGNPVLISPDDLIADGLIEAADLSAVEFAAERVEYGPVNRFKAELLPRAWERFRTGSAAGLKPAYAAFRKAHADWLDDFALFMAIKESRPGVPWAEWPEELALREPAAIKRTTKALAESIDRIRFSQFLFFRQLGALRHYSKERGVKLIGDLPIFISAESADVWAHPELFELDTQRRPKVVAGVPPDFFCTTGQRWGNPHYNWKVMRRDGFAWWIARLKATLAEVDLVRLDHFRGFEAYWEVPASCLTAEVGRWVKAPGAALFKALRTALGGLPMIAEDLGEITPEVDALRHEFGLPGMRILQFAFGGAVEDRFLPHSFDHDCVVYTGTHDNDTTAGWYAGLSPDELASLRRYIPGVERDPTGELIRLAWASVANCAIAPLQDVLGLGNEARMNLPGTDVGNWSWRFTTDMLAPDRFEYLAELTATYGRSPTSGSK